MRAWYRLLCGPWKRPTVKLDWGADGALQRREEGGEDVEHAAGRGGEDLAQALVDDRVEDDRAMPVAREGSVDLRHGVAGAFLGIDIGQAHELEAHVLELCEQRLAEGLGRDAGAVGDEEGGSVHGCFPAVWQADFVTALR